MWCDHHSAKETERTVEVGLELTGKLGGEGAWKTFEKGGDRQHREVFIK